jgi:hypothetical protein
MNLRLLMISWVALSGLIVAPWPRAHAAEEPNEVGLVIGSTLTPGRTLSAGGEITFNPSLALGAEYDRRLIGDRVAIYGGLDLLVSPFDVKLGRRPAGSIRQYAYLFLTPHVKLKLNSSGVISPWVSIGGGYAGFTETPNPGVSGFRQGTHTNTLQFGGGVDTRPMTRVLGIPVGARFEVRDFYSGAPNYNQNLSSDRQHNVAVTGGLLLRF